MVLCLNQLYLRNQFTVYKEKFVFVEDIPEFEILLSACVRMSSTCGSQGFSRCGCKSDRCSRRKEKEIVQLKMPSKCNQMVIVLINKKRNPPNRLHINYLVYVTF